jgi:hypothetical protein
LTSFESKKSAYGEAKEVTLREGDEITRLGGLPHRQQWSLDQLAYILKRIPSARRYGRFPYVTGRLGKLVTHGEGVKDFELHNEDGKIAGSLRLLGSFAAVEMPRDQVLTFVNPHVVLPAGTDAPTITLSDGDELPCQIAL